VTKGNEKKLQGHETNFLKWFRRKRNSDSFFSETGQNGFFFGNGTDKHNVLKRNTGHQVYRATTF
jgi:hypothetical protein